MRKRIAALLAVMIAAGLAQGCWNYREVDSLMIVAGVAIDRGYEGRRFHLTIDLADTTSAGKDKPVVSTLVEAEGDTIFDAVRNAMKRVGMQIYWQNCQVAVISQDVAQESILPVVDWLVRDAEPRLTMELFVSQEKTAKEILQSPSATMSITSFEIDKIYELNEKVQPAAEYRTLLEIYNTLSDKGKALALPALRLVDNADSKVCSLNGMAIFNGDRLVGYLTPDDSKYAMFATGHIKGGTLCVKAATGNTIAALMIDENKTGVNVYYENGKVRIVIQTKTETVLDELDTMLDITNRDNMSKLALAAEGQLAERIARTVQMVQSQYGRDIFGFGDVLHRQDPAAWYALGKDWDEAFKSAGIQVSCKVNIVNRSENISPVEVVK